MLSSTLLIANDALITCPACQKGFSLEQGFARQALEGIQTESQTALAQLLAEARAVAERQVRAVTEASLRPQLQALEEQLQLRIERTRLQDERSAMALEVQRQVDFKCAERESQVRSQEQERSQLREAERQKKLQDARDQLEDAQRRLAQGSQQLQGEVLELAIEEALRREFPLDTIEEVKKGVRGADVVQLIATREGHVPIKVLWESKRAKDFSAAWIGKLKEDMRACGAEVGVLVTLGDAVPHEWARRCSAGRDARSSCRAASQRCSGWAGKFRGWRSAHCRSSSCRRLWRNEAEAH